MAQVRKRNNFGEKKGMPRRVGEHVHSLAAHGHEWFFGLLVGGRPAKTAEKRGECFFEERESVYEAKKQEREEERKGAPRGHVIDQGLGIARHVHQPADGRAGADGPTYTGICGEGGRRRKK